MAALLLSWLLIVLARSKIIFVCGAATICAILAANYHSREWLEQPFEVHFFFGIALTYTAGQVLSGDGRPATANPLQGLTLTLVSASIFYGDWTHTTYLAHLILDSSGVVIGAMSLLQSCLTSRSPTGAALVQRVRALTDPACLSAVGFVFLKHIHHEAYAHTLADPAAHASITNLYHTSIAWSMLNLAAVQLASSFVHAGMGYERKNAELCKLMRRVLACAWVYPGLVLIHMACVLHVRAFPDGSNLHARWARVGLFHASEEAMCLYLAQLVLLDVLIVASLMALTEERDAADSTSATSTKRLGRYTATRVAPEADDDDEHEARGAAHDAGLPPRVDSSSLGDAAILGKASESASLLNGSTGAPHR